MKNIKTTEPFKFNRIIQIFRVSMYVLAGLAIIFLPVPLFKNVSIGLKITMGLIFILYSGFRIYQLIQARKIKPNDEE